MATTLENKLAHLSSERRQLVEQQAQALIAEERVLQSVLLTEPFTATNSEVSDSQSIAN